MLALAVMMVMSSLTVAKASDVYKGFRLSTESYYGDDYDISGFQAKDTTSSIKVYVTSANLPLQYSAVGSMQESGRNYADCSNGQVYKIVDATTFEMYNLVKEYGYRYAAIRVDSLTDAYTCHEGEFMAN